MIKIFSGAQNCWRTAISGLAKPPFLQLINKENVLLNSQPVRHTGFFNRLTQKQLWKGVLSVSNAGKRKGRGRDAGRRGKRDLNIGQKIGEGKIRVSWPGLNTSVLGSYGIGKIQKLPEIDVTKLKPVVSKHSIKRRRSLHPLERGWSGRQMRGRKIGPPDPVNDETFEDFETIVLDHKLKSVMTAVLGRKRYFSSVVATGNGNGLIGIGLAKTMDSKSSIHQARKRACRRLHTVDLIEKHTVNHDFFSEFGRTKVTVLKQPEGYGLHCHRIIKALCQLIGIENLYAKIKGPTTPKNVIRAFIVGLLKQKTYQEIAEEKKLHLVEFKEETLNFPRVLASPEKCLTPREARKDLTTFEEYIMGGRLRYIREAKIPFYMKLPSWTTHLKMTLYHRNHEKVKLELLVKYGDLESHLTKIYPECRRHPKAEKLRWNTIRD